jgi:hypothetical protein
MSPHPNDIRVRSIHMIVPWKLSMPIVKDAFLAELAMTHVILSIRSIPGDTHEMDPLRLPPFPVIFTICSGIHCIEPSVCSANTFQCADIFFLALIASCSGVVRASVRHCCRLLRAWAASLHESPQTCLIIPINDTCTCHLALIVTISDASKKQPKWLDSDAHISLSRSSHGACLNHVQSRCTITSPLSGMRPTARNVIVASKLNHIGRGLQRQRQTNDRCKFLQIEGKDDQSRPGYHRLKLM